MSKLIFLILAITVCISSAYRSRSGRKGRVAGRSIVVCTSNGGECEGDDDCCWTLHCSAGKCRDCSNSTSKCQLKKRKQIVETIKRDSSEEAEEEVIKALFEI